MYCITLTAQPTPPSGKKWQKVNQLTDDFNSFDSSKWQKGHPYWSGRSPSQFNNNNLSWQNGNLRLKGSLRNSNRQGDFIWTACLTSKSKSFKKGMYAEARIKNADMAIVSSFWMQGSETEIDVIENWGEVKNNRWRHLDYSMEMNTHYFPKPCGFDCDKTTQKHYKNPGNVGNSSAYAVYGVWWVDSRNIRWYRDGRQVASVTLPYDFNEDMFMFFDMEAFTWGPGLPSNADMNNGNKNTAYYDWVRTYKLVNGNSTGGGNGGNTAVAALKGNNAKYVSSENGTKPMTCNRNQIGGWEKFEIKVIGSTNGNDIVTLKGNNGNYVSSENGTKPITCDRPRVGAWEKFELIHHGNQVYSLKGNNGKYLSSENGTRSMTCSKTNIGNQERFNIQYGLSRANDIDSQKSVGFSVYPNPTLGKEVTIDVGANAGMNLLKVYDIQGRMILDKQFTENQYQINSTLLGAKGLYIIKIKNDSGDFTKKIFN
ncbi:T9SS type A sorting domain-containing protein [Aquimarina sp. RZ0]|uniref:T9SS type A sorting domain-containing protein n=1 Tax=Aquimarina sp. RZ0 TaxID=2607730 RepID=UPI001CB6F2BC|nr:T9SS type A sorting domain-containing protein [Aquimarina sp. RZ0]